MDEVIISHRAVDSGLQSFTLSDLFFWIYLAGILLTATLFIIKLSGLLHFIRKTEIRRTGKYSLLSGNSEILSFSFFNYIFIGRARELSESDRNRIMEHEMTHVNQRHSYDSIYFEILTILFWFNPFIWLYKKMIVDLHEYLADEAVVRRSGMEEYSRLLVQQVIGLSDLRPASHFDSSKTLKRINKMKNNTKRSNKSVLAMYVPILALVFFIVSCNDNNQNITKSEQEADSGNNKTPQVSEQDMSNRIESLQKDSVYNIVDEQPTPTGGMTEFYQEIAKKLKYPDQARKENITGRVYIQFVINPDGSFSGLKVLKGIGHGCDEAAMDALKTCKNWKPGIKDGKTVSTRMVLPVVFSLGDK
jgi:TonB family protein